jgi:lysophospholipase L1-like esterase
MRAARAVIGLAAIALCGLAQGSRADDQAEPLKQTWDYAVAMKRVEAGFHGRPGVVIHVGDSITYANPYGAWARGGQGQTADDKAALKWMHAGADNDTDGWWLARFDHPDGGRSYTAASGMRADELLAGGKQHLPSLKDLLAMYRPQMVVLMIGTNDASAGRLLAAYQKDLIRATDLILAAHAIPILSTIPPHPGRLELAKSYNDAVRQLAKERNLPLIDFEREILRRRPNDWSGTLLGKGDVHPTAEHAGVNAAAAPTAGNLANCGYLLRGWLSVRKIAEVTRTVIDALPAK